MNNTLLNNSHINGFSNLHGMNGIIEKSETSELIADLGYMPSTPKISHPTLSMVIPTRNEAGNVAVLVHFLEQALTNIPFEVLFVDDSDDETPEVVRKLSEESECDVILLHRAPDERADGLGGAVTMGLREARAPWVCVMDADLQHPPELVPQILAKAQSTNADVVVASRFRGDGDAGGLNFIRFGISQSFDTIARLAFPKQLQNVSDPMSGFFMVRKNAIDVDELRPRGFKILLEILVRSGVLNVEEVPFQFGERHEGESKADLREGLRYLSLIFHLRIGEDVLRFARFCMVGFSGLFLNLLLHYIFTDTLGVHYLMGAVLATQGSSIWNFVLTEAWVFKGRQQRWNRLYRLIMFLVMNNASLVLRGPIIVALTGELGMHHLSSNLISLLALTLVRYALADTWIWKRPTAERQAPALERAV